jgi:CHASE3 domain sensor protein
MTRQLAVKVGCGAALLMVGAIGWVSYGNTAASIESARRVAHTHEVLAVLESVLSDIIAAETEGRSYVMVSEKHHSEPLSTAVAAIDQTLERLRQLTSDNPNQQQRISLLKALIDEKIVQLRHSIDLQREEGFQPEAQTALSDLDQTLMNRIRWMIETMKGEERGLLLRREEVLKSRARMTYGTILLGTGVCFMLLLLVAYLLMREMAERTRLEHELRKAKEAAEAGIH